MKHFSAICFDMDGVLIQSREATEKAWMAVGHEYGVNIDITMMNSYIHGRPGFEVISTLFKHLSPPEQHLIQEKASRIEAMYPAPLTWGVREFIKCLKSQSIPLALVTSSDAERVGILLRAHGMESVFDAIVSRDDTPTNKPEPECYLAAARYLNTAPEKCLVFEDSRSGMLAAIRSGAQGIGIGSDQELIQMGAKALLQDFHGLEIISIQNHSYILKSENF
ncbi:HAD family hydrolase [Comamonas composti]|uniref:HAD family hydrolase n=1 Tax=Comamonas composti TaxID=408558 RepID=UPI00040A40EE|nr:HAD family phosphatase [Comamonas composti]